MKKPSGPRNASSMQNLVDAVAIDQLAKIIARYDLSEVEISLGELRLRLARQRAPLAHNFGVTADHPHPGAEAGHRPGAAAGPPESASADLAGAVKSPMVGTAYLRPSAEAKPFVEIGTMVKSGDKLMLVEAMKTFNDIVAPRAGKVVRILVVDGTPVEYDQPLMIIE